MRRSVSLGNGLCDFKNPPMPFQGSVFCLWLLLADKDVRTSKCHASLPVCLPAILFPHHDVMD